jgi:PAS domain S-box-containing protein
MTDCLQRLRGLLENATDLYQVISSAGTVLYVNPAWCQTLGYQEVEAIQRSFVDLLHPDSRDRYLIAVEAVASDRQDQDLEITVLTKAGHPLQFNGRLSYHAKGRRGFEIWALWQRRSYTAQAQVVNQMVGRSLQPHTPSPTVLHSPEMLLRGQNYILELIARGTPLSDVLNELACFIEQQSSEMLCSFQLIDACGTSLRRSAAPSLPESFQAAIDRIPVGPLTCSCGAAAYYQERIISPDITIDPIWDDYRDLAISHGLRACWSTPIMSSQGNVLGTFAMYYHEVRIPSETELDLIELSTHLASIAIERQQSETALKTSEERLRLALNASEMGIWDCNLCTGEVVWSDNLEQLYGLPQGAFNGNDQAFLSLVHPDDRQFVFQASRQAIRQRTNYDVEFRVVRPDQQLRWIVSKGQVIYGDNGRPVRMAGVNLDITDRKILEESLRQTTKAQDKELQSYAHELTETVKRLQAEIAHREQVEQALRESEERYRSVIAALQEGIVLQDTDGHVSACNASAERILGLSANQISGKMPFDPAWRTVHEDGSPFPGDTHPAIITLLTGKPCSNVVMGVHKPNGMLTWISVNSQPLFRQGESRPYAVVTSFSDITARKQAETALQNSEALYRAIVEDQVELVCRFLPDGTLTFVNDAYCRVLGMSREELLGHNYKMFLIALDRETQVPLTASLHSDSRVSWLEHQVILPNGSVCWQQWNSRAIFDKQGNFIEFQAVGRDITVRKQTEAELALREARYALAVRAGQVGVWDWNLATDDLYMDANLKDMLGFTDSDSQTYLKDWRQVVHPDDVDTVMTVAHEHLDGILPGYQLEYRMLCKDGTIRWFLARGTGFQDEDGKPYRLMGTNTDITNRKLAEEELRRQHLRSQLLAETTLRIRQSLRLDEILHTTVTEIQKLLQADRVLIYRLNSDGTGVVVQEAVVPGHRVTLGQPLNDPCLQTNCIEQYSQGQISAIADLDNPSVQPCHAEFLKQFGVKANLVVPILLGGQDSISKRQTLEPEDDETVSSAALANSAGTLLSSPPATINPPSLWGLLIAHQCDEPRQWSDFEVELLKQLADQVAIALAQSQLLESLQESEERFYGAFEYAAIGMALTGLDGRLLQVNPALSRIVGYSEAELLTMTLQSLTHPDDLNRDADYVQHYVQHMLAGDMRFYQIEKRYIHKQGQIVWVLLSISRVCDAQGHPLYFVTQIQDITERKRAEEKILKALQKEKELNELKSRFVSMISHEFRTPLTTIQSASELLEHYEWSAQQKQERFQQIHNAVQHMTQLLEDVLLIGKADAGKLKIKPELLDLVDFCQGLMADLEFTAAKHHQFSFTYDGEAQPVWLDPKLLRQTVSNLLLNAIKYSPDGGNIRLHLLFSNDRIVIQVQDEGIGIPHDERERLFEAFYRATNADTIQGTGLGLAIVKKCVDLCEGTIALDSEIGVGTTFTIDLPLLENA